MWRRQCLVLRHSIFGTGQRPSKLIKHGGEATTAMPKYLGGEEVAQGVDPVTGHTLTEKGPPQVVRE
ncbi:hypothetical protein DPMN_080552 [Dreissena polymorpha]|uniref:Uncharacterized protein n=1 Tax=Dreissena polymorpha TaxID=45954 RepID=A0A9D3YRL7_DREPO|nr:hypothetical protein DPMN_080552 [Dreissena polymorpha]